MPEHAAPPGRGKQAAIIVAALALVVVVLLFALMRTPSNPEPTPTTAVNSKRGPFDVLTSPPAANAPVQAPPSLNAPVNAAAANTAAPSPKPKPATSNTPTPAPTKSFDPNALPPGHPRLSAADEKSQVSVQWLGGDCFYIQSPGCVAVVTDPFDPATVGLPAPSTGAHFVTVSRDTPEHNAVGAVHAFQGAEKRVLRGQSAEQGDLKVTAIKLAAGPEFEDFGYVVDAGGLRIAHLGGAQGPLTPEQVKQLGAVDLLLLPVGDGSLAPKDAVKIAQAVNPRVVIPMAYSTNAMPDSARKLKPVDAFVGASPYARVDREADVMLISKAELPPKTEIWTLRYGH